MSSARCYIAATGVAFALMAVAHGVRAVAEGSGLLREPVFIVTTIASLGLAVWAGLLLFRKPRA